MKERLDFIKKNGIIKTVIIPILINYWKRNDAYMMINELIYI